MLKDGTRNRFGFCFLIFSVLIVPKGRKGDSVMWDQSGMTHN